MEDKEKLHIKAALEMAAKAMAVALESQVSHGVHHIDRYYFTIAGQRDLHLARYKDTHPTNDDPFGESLPAIRGPAIFVVLAGSMPAAVAVSMLTGAEKE